MTFWLFLQISCKLPNTTALNMTTSVRISYLWRRLLDMKNQRGTYPSSQSDQTSSQTFQYTGFLISLNSPASTHFTLTPPHTFSRVFGSSFNFYIYMYLFSFLSLSIYIHTRKYMHIFTSSFPIQADLFHYFPPFSLTPLCEYCTHILVCYFTLQSLGIYLIVQTNKVTKPYVTLLASQIDW